MSPRPKISSKHLQIDKANQSVIIATSMAVVIVVFGFFVGRALWLRQSHQNRVIQHKVDARDQLKKNIEAKNQIVEAYRDFTSTPENFLGGSAVFDSEGDRDGDNARLILDALPSKYDFPGLASSLEKILIDNGYTIESIEGQDDEVAQSALEAQSHPEPIEMPFTFTVETSYGAVQPLISFFERSIRPFKVRLIDIEAEQGTVKLKVEASTYYQPAKTLSITKEVIR